MTQENIIGNNQAQKINSVRSEIGVGDRKLRSVRAYTSRESLFSVCVCVCVCMRACVRVCVCVAMGWPSGAR